MKRMRSWARAAGRAASALTLALCTQCRGCDDDRRQGAPPPDLDAAPQAPAADVCAGGGGKDDDAVSAPFFPPAVAGWCLDPHGDAKTYGEKGKLRIDQLCDTALDGGCEEYRRMGVTRTVILHYVEGKGKGTVEVFLSQFAGDGAYAIMTARLVGEVDPTDPSMPRQAAVPGQGAVGAVGTLKAYAWRGAHFLELTYENDDQTPEQLKRSSDEILPKLAAAIAAKLPDASGVPEAAQLLPEKSRVPLGVVYDPKAVLGMANVGAGAVGYYKDGGKRWRVLAIARPDAEQAKDAFKALRQAGAAGVPGLGDEAMAVVLHPGPSRPKLEYAIARKGKVVVGVGDEELLLSSGASAPPPNKPGEAELTKDEKLAKLRELVGALR